ncbi:MAG: PQQ-dependent sugar dehydrogenase [Candidatus Competibacterales bacterium]
MEQRLWAPLGCTVLAAAAFVATLSVDTASADGAVYRSAQHDFRVTTVAEGLRYPWGLAFLPDGRMLVTERTGRLRVIEADQLLADSVAGLPDHIAVGGQGGLFDVLPHPDFAANGMIYLSFAGEGPGGSNTEVVRGILDGMALTQVETLFRAQTKSSGGRHFGGRLAFGADGMLYLALGDRGSRNRAQDTQNHVGSLIRLRPDGGIPADNPFADGADALPQIYTYGNRNMQGLALQPGSDRLWTHEHGPRGGDEVNVMLAGANYGWPVVTYGVNYSGSVISRRQRAPGMEDPRHYWDPSIAPSGMAFYTGQAFPNWQGDLFVGALKYQLLVRLEIDGTEVVGEERLLQREYGRIRDVRVGPDGHLYLLTDAPMGQVLRLEPVAGAS